MKHLANVVVMGLAMAFLASVAHAQSARQLLDREDPKFCAHEDVWVRAAVLVKDSLPAWNWTASQRDAIQISFADRRFDFAHPDRVQVICSATVTLSVPGVSKSLQTRFDAVPRGDQPEAFRLVATDGLELLILQGDFKAQWRLHEPSAFDRQP